MIEKKSNTLRIISIVLTVVFLTPFAIQISHSFDNDHLAACKVLETHLHEKKADCSRCDFQISTFVFNFPINLEFVSVQIIDRLALTSTNLVDKPSIYINLVRGPPSFS